VAPKQTPPVIRLTQPKLVKKRVLKRIGKDMFCTGDSRRSIMIDQSSIKIQNIDIGTKNSINLFNEEGGSININLNRYLESADSELYYDEVDTQENPIY
jgi:hypothetical protein